ncbi:MAG TPA: nicotinamide-nucleotide amidohydrolase family protein, partial [Chitinophagales bacterium]|nr:nicotinamide-nucleotide amidohydrolase family protein [Chitinophagales bacterium]
VPVSCTVVKNNMGTAPGMWFEKENSIIISMPGVPYEMQAMLKDTVIPLLQTRFQFPAIYNIHIMTSGIGESWLAEKIADIEDSLPDSIGLAYLPSPGIVKLRLTARGKNQEVLQINTQPFVDAIVKRLGDKVFSVSAETMEEKIGSMLNILSATLGTVESCTGGSIARKIISVPGSSDYYLGSIVAYHNDIKTSILGVTQNTLNENGAVSEEAIREMLEGGLHTLKTDYVIATSGIAGPGGGTADKPVGTVFIGITGKGEIVIKKFLFANNRPINIEFTCMFALHELRMMLQKHLEKQA